MARRRTRIGRWAFGRSVSPDQHAWEVLQRILTRGHPLTEDALFLCMWNVLRQKGSRVFQKVRSSSDLGGYRYFHFSPDIDLLEVRDGKTVVGYELKGYRRKGKSVEPPMFYEGIEQGLAYLVNPVRSPFSTSFAGSIFDHVYVVHPEGSEVERMSEMVMKNTPLGLVMVGTNGTKELIHPKPNPYVDGRMKDKFLANLDTFATYTKYKLKPIQ